MTLPPLWVGFVAGSIGAGYVVVSLFFLRFWRRTGDLLFAVFSLAFAMMAVGQVWGVAVNVPVESSSHVYLFRLCAYVLIILAIVRKNL